MIRSSAQYIRTLMHRSHAFHSGQRHARQMLEARTGPIGFHRHDGKFRSEYLAGALSALDSIDGCPDCVRSLRHLFEAVMNEHA